MRRSFIKYTYSYQKNCKDCIYHITKEYDGIRSSRCLLYKYMCIKSCEEVNDYASFVRADNKRCGIEGKYFLDKRPLFNINTNVNTTKNTISNKDINVKKDN